MRKNKSTSKNKTTSVSKSPNRSKSRSESQPYSEIDDDQIDEIFKNITLKKPRNPFSQFVMQEAAKIKTKTGKFDLKTEMVNITDKWEKLDESGREKYLKLFEDEKIKYQKDLLLVRHYLFKDYNDTVMRKPTAYRIFLQERMRDGFEKGLEPKEVQSEASKDWKKMEDKEKAIYLNKKKENDNWFAKAEKTKRVTSLSLFVSQKFQEAKNAHKPVPTLADIAPSWKKLSQEEKQHFEKYADEINQERRHLQDLFDITHGVKPRRPAGAYKAFLQEKAKEGVLKSLQDGKELWDKLTEDEKEVYLAKAKRTQLAYKYKKMIYEKKIKKIIPRKPGGAFCFFLKEKKGQIPKNGESFLKYWKEEWNKLEDNKKKHYEAKATAAMEKYEKKKKAFENKVFDLPQRPMSGYMIFISQSIKKIKDKEDEDGVDKKDRTPTAELVKKFGKEWMDMKQSEKDYYEKLASKGRKVYKKQLKEFNQNGYYTKNKAKKEVEEEGEDDEDEKKSEKSSKVSKKSSRKNSRKKKAKDEDDEEDEKEKKKSTRKKRAPSESKSVKKEKKGGKSKSKSKSKSKKSNRK